MSLRILSGAPLTIAVNRKCSFNSICLITHITYSMIRKLYLESISGNIYLYNK